jgi:hypothetical protein
MMQYKVIFEGISNPVGFVLVEAEKCDCGTDVAANEQYAEFFDADEKLVAKIPLGPIDRILDAHNCKVF